LDWLLTDPIEENQEGIKMRIKLILVVSLLIIFCTACIAGKSDVKQDSAKQSLDSAQNNAIWSTDTPQVGTLQSVDSTVIQTSTGDLVIDSIRLVDEVHGTKAGPDQTILLILFKRPDGGDIKMEDFLAARQNVEAGIKGEDGKLYVCTMGGKLESGETALGCFVPVSMETYKFYWGDNSVIELVSPNG
jgi:hypothetical protein